MRVGMRTGLCVVGVAASVVMGCGEGSPVKPTGSASVTTPRVVEPAPNGVIRNVDQPVTLKIANSLVTQTGGTTYTFEVASDAGFASKVQTKTDVAESTSGQTIVRLDTLPAGADYYWRTRANAGGTTGVYSATYKFTVGPAVVLNAPSAVSPVANAETAARPALTVNNAQVTGPAGPVTYKFELAANPAFSPVLLEATVAQGGGRTTYTPTEDLPAETTIYWRVTAIDAANGVTSPASTVAAFVTNFAIDLRRVVYLQSPDISGWPQTGNLLSVEQDGNAALGGPMCMRFTDPGWPDSPWVYGNDPNFGVFANQWYFARIGGTWYGGAGEWIYRTAASVCKAGQGTRTIGPDSGFGQPFSSWVPRVGEMVGYAVTSVARRGSIRRTVDERTNIVVQPWRDTSLGSAR